MEKLRNVMYGDSRGRFSEIMTYLTDPNLETDNIPESVSKEDIDFALKYKGVSGYTTSRRELTYLLATGDDSILAANGDEYMSDYFTDCARLNRYLLLNGVKYDYFDRGFNVYTKSPRLLKLIGNFTEVNAND